MPGVVTLALAVSADTGSRFVSEPVNGLAHLFEHMVFKGTHRRSARAIAEEMEDVGGQLNAWTSRDATMFHARLLARDLAVGVDLIADLVTGARFDQDDLVREKDVVLQELGEVRDTPDDIVFDHFQTTAFPDQPMGRPVLGTEGSIKAMTRDALRGYMGRNYGPSSMVVAGAGALDHDTLLDLVGKHFADLPKVDIATPEAARYAGGEFRETRELDQVHIVLGFPSVPYLDPMHWPTQVLGTLLGGGMSSRLFQEIREKRGLVYSIYAFASPFRDGGLFQIYAGTGEKEAAELMPVTLEELLKVQRDVTEDELARAKAQLRASLLMSLESTGSRCEQLARQLQVHGRVIPIEETKQRIASVTVEQVQQAAARAFRQRPTLAVMGPSGEVPSVATIMERLAA
jgi:predicted Zn-dependent peptidase